jgi:hypothetical protein
LTLDLIHIFVNFYFKNFSKNYNQQKSMIFNPVYILSRIIIKLFIKNLNTNFLFSFIKLSGILLKNIGLFATVKIIKFLFKYMNINTSKIINLQSLQNYLVSQTLNPIAIGLVID